MCIYTSIHSTCIWIYIYIYICIYIYTYIHIYIHLHIYVYIHIYVYKYIRIYRYIHIYTFTHIHIYVHTNIYIYIYIYNHTYMFHISPVSIIFIELHRVHPFCRVTNTNHSTLVSSFIFMFIHFPYMYIWSCMYMPHPVNIIDISIFGLTKTDDLTIGSSFESSLHSKKRWLNHISTIYIYIYTLYIFIYTLYIYIFIYYTTYLQYIYNIFTIYLVYIHLFVHLLHTKRGYPLPSDRPVGVIPCDRHISAWWTPIAAWRRST